jgi:hypothetical protein
MDVSHQLQQVRVFLAENGLVTVLKQVPASPVFQVEADRVARQKPLQKIIAIGVLPENLPLLDASNDNVMQRSTPI